MNCEKIRTGGSQEKKEDEGMCGLDRHTYASYHHTSHIMLTHNIFGLELGSQQGSDGPSSSKKRKADPVAIEGSAEPQSKKKKTSKSAKPPGIPGGKGSRTKGALKASLNNFGLELTGTRCPSIRITLAQMSFTNLLWRGLNS